jgi:periplasmic divalent cation tolerance protein
MPLAVFTTLGSEAEARRMARAAVEARLAACVQIERIDSVFLWDGVEEEPEWRLLFKVSDTGYDRLAAFILDTHPYDEPALWAAQMTRVSPSFAAWIDESVTDG